MRIEETKQITQKVTIAHKCDVCNKIHEGLNTPDDWHNFSHNHNDWGNDSIDSYEWHDVCSVDCYKVKFKECVKDLGDRKNAEIDGFDIQFARSLFTDD